MKYILPFFACLMLMAGCESLNRPVENAAVQVRVAAAEDMVLQVRGIVATLQQKLAEAHAFIAAQDERIAQARALAESSQSDAARAIVASLEQIKAEALAAIPQTQEALDKFAAKLPEVEKLAQDIKAEAAKLGEGGTSPLWYVIGTLLLPIAIKGAQVGTVGIPGVGPVVAGVAEAAIRGLWDTMATKRLKARDAEIEARSAALDHQIAVTNELVNAAGEKAEPILDAAKARQKAAGVYTTLEPLVAALEAKG